MRASKPQIELERPVFRTFVFAAAVVACGMAVAAPASAKTGGGAQSSDTVGRVVSYAVKLDGKPRAKPKRKAKKVLRCAIFGRYIQGCGS